MVKVGTGYLLNGKVLEAKILGLVVSDIEVLNQWEKIKKLILSSASHTGPMLDILMDPLLINLKK